MRVWGANWLRTSRASTYRTSGKMFGSDVKVNCIASELINPSATSANVTRVAEREFGLIRAWMIAPRYLRTSRLRFMMPLGRLNDWRLARPPGPTWGANQNCTLTVSQRDYLPEGLSSRLLVNQFCDQNRPRRQFTG